MLKKRFYKSLIILLCLLSFSTIANSQVLITLLLGNKLNTGAIEFGLTGGFNRNNLIGLKDAGGQNNFNLGFYFDFKLSKEKPWFLYTGVLVKSTMGADNISLYDLDDDVVDSVMVGGHVNRKINYFNVPLTVKYRFKSNLFVLGGFQLGLRHKATDEFTNEVYKKDDLVLKIDSRDNYKRLDAGLTAGFGYKFRYGMQMNMGLRYYYGLVDVFKEGPDYGTNSSLYVFAEIPIGVKRKLRPQEQRDAMAEKERLKQEKKAAKKQARKDQKK